MNRLFIAVLTAFLHTTLCQLQDNQNVRVVVGEPAYSWNVDTQTRPPDSIINFNASKVTLDVYYETDCPDSKRFITGRLFPIYQDIESFVNITLVPFGKATEYHNPLTGKYQFTCHHGRSECYGNTVQSCAIYLYPEMRDWMNFINCMESQSWPSQSGQKCARRAGLDWNKIEKCATGDEGNRLMHKNAQATLTLEPPVYFVPWIVINKEFSRQTLRNSLINLLIVVCEAYEGNAPDICLEL